MEDEVNRMEMPSKTSYPVNDQRYPRYAAVMNDGRLVTDYKSHCEYNVSHPKHGNALRGFLQHNADALMQVSRNRQAERSGAQYYKASTVTGPRIQQQCTEYECEFSLSQYPPSIGIQRSETVPTLFGTFSEPSKYSNATNIALTTVFEGGRNTPHGRDFVPLGLKGFSPRNSQYGSSG